MDVNFMICKENSNPEFIKFNVSQDDIIVKLKKKLFTSYNVESNNKSEKYFILKHNNIVLDNNKNLLSYNIDINDCVHFTEIQEINDIVVKVLGNFNVPSVIQVNLNETVSQMKHIISSYSNYFGFMIFKDGIELSDNSILGECNFNDDCQIYAIGRHEGKLKVNSIIREQTDLSLDYQITDKVIELKQKVSKLYEYEINNFELFLEKEMLDGNKFLFEYSISDDSTIMYVHATRLQVTLVNESVIRGISSEILKAKTAADNTIIVKRYHICLDQRLQKALFNELIAYHFIQINKYFPKLEGIFKQDNYVYIAMEYVDRESLDKYIMHDPPISDLRLAKWTTDILNALVFLHDNKIICRNLMPSNILLMSNNQIKLCGFGSSRYFNGETKEEFRRGFPQTKPKNYRYMAPEMLNNEAYGSTVDTWSLGVILLAFVQGHHLYPALDDIDVAMKVAAEKSIEFDAPPERSSKLIDFIKRCLQGNPEFRPTPEELLNDKFIKEEPDNLIACAVAETAW